MKIANADKLKKHFESVVDVHLFTVPTILTIIDTFSSEVPEGAWIPIKTRPGTDEEYETFGMYDDCPREDFRVFDCPLPDDGQEVLVTTQWGNVCIDIWHSDDCGSYFEDNYDDDDVIAWMPMPKAYIGGDKP